MSNIFWGLLNREEKDFDNKSELHFFDRRREARQYQIKMIEKVVKVRVTILK